MDEKVDPFCSLPALSPALSADPITFMVAEHDRHRKVCAILSRSTREGQLTPAMLERVSSYLGDEFARHHRFESKVLFPLIRQRLPDDHGLAEKLAEVSQVQRNALRWGGIIRRHAGHGANCAPPQAEEKLRSRVLAFTRRQFSSLTFENAVILRIAAAVLRKSDFRKLSETLEATYFSPERPHAG